VRRALLLVAFAVTLWLGWVRETRFPLRGAEEPPQRLLIPPGASAESIGRQLEDLGLVRHPTIFRFLAFLRGDSGRLRAGEYSFEGPLSLDEIIGMLVRGEVVRRDATFPEGKSLEEMAIIASGHGISADAFLRAARDPTPIHDLDPEASDLEGYLFPDTYDVAPPAAAATLVGRMVERFRAVASPDLPRLAARGLTLRQVVTLASLVELETARAQERPRIAAVFLNRLKLGMPLQTDPTVIYALRKAGTYDGNIRKKDLAIDSPYNTYNHSGLPPGPIASPGRDSIEAVLAPAPAKDLYFVSRNDGTHQFSETLAEHERAVDRYQRRRGAVRDGERG
jgi:UPF0755 protein